MTAKQIMMSAIRTQVCGAERIRYGELTDEQMRSLYSLSKSHDMAHIVSAELSEQGLLKDGEEISEKFRKQHMIAVFRYERINYELEELCAALEEARIPFMPLKGSCLRAYYPEPWMRTSCDIDVLVHSEDLQKATEYLKEHLGYEMTERGSHDISMFSPSGVHVELHYDLVEEGRANNCRKILGNAWNYAAPVSDGAFRHAFTDEMFYLYHIAHMAKHFENGGCGVRPYLDIWILDNILDYDKQARDDLLERGELLKFAESSRHLACVWFSNGTDDELTARIEQYILFSGVYGNIDNRIAVQQNKQGGRFKYILSRMFLPYDVIKLSYPILQKHRWLLPVMQIRRWFKVFFGGRFKRSLNEVNVNAKMSDERKQDTKALLESLGLQ